MAISDGQRVRALESNAAWASKTVDNTFAGIQTLANGSSGPTIANTQQKINDIDADLVVAQNDISNLQVDLAAAETDIAQLQVDVSLLQALDTFVYVGSWDANSNTPTIADGDGGAGVGPGAVYRVTVGGTQNLGSGPITFNANDKVVYNFSGVWEKWDVSDEVTSVNGQTGAVSLALDDIADVNAPAAPQYSLLQKGVSDWETLNPNETLDNAALTGSNQVVPATDGFFKVVRLTNAGLVSVEGIGYTYDQQKIILVNDTGVSFDVLNDAAASPTQGIITGTGNDLALDDQQTLLLVYDATEARWRVIGGTGAGGGVGFQEVPGGLINGVNTIFGPLTYTPSSDDSILVFVDGIALKNSEWSKSGSNVVLSVAPVLGQEVYVYYLTQGTIAPPPVISGVLKTEYRTLTLGEEVAKAITLLQTPVAPGEVLLDVKGGGAQFYSDDFVVSGSTLSWNGLGLDGLLVAGDKLRVTYVY